MIKFDEYAKNQEVPLVCPRCEMNNEGLYRDATAPVDTPFVCASCYRKELYGEEEGTD